MTKKTLVRILSLNEVMEITTLSKSTLKRLEESGEFPRRIHLTETRIGSARIGYNSEDIEKWIKTRRRKS